MEQALEELVSVQRALTAAEDDDARMADLDALFERRRRILAPGHVDRFWLTALLNHSSMASLLSEMDCSVLVFLADVHVDTSFDGGAPDPDNDSFRLVLTFAENQWFSDTKLVKEYIYHDSLRGLVIESTAIQWKQGQRLTHCHTEADVPSPSAFVDARFFAWLEADDDGHGWGPLIREFIYPRAISYYFGTVDDDDEEDDDEGDDDDDDSTNGPSQR